MDDLQHSVQDSCEAYAVYVMQRTAEELGSAGDLLSGVRHTEFLDYLYACDLSLEDFQSGDFGKYKSNVDDQVPRFVRRLVDQYPGVRFTFENVERVARNAGLKADVNVHRSDSSQPIALSVKNYIGSSGITRPQVSSGTFLSFAAGFVFSRVGVGTYEDSRPDAGRTWFRGSDTVTRDQVLTHLGWAALIPFFRSLEDLKADIRADLLGPDCEMYDSARVRAAVERCAVPGIEAVLNILQLIGEEAVRQGFLVRIGMDGEEEALFFDSDRYVDSVTNVRYHNLRAQLNAASTSFTVKKHGQGIRFEFASSQGESLLRTDVPFTINTNGAWYRPKDRYEGVRSYDDKGHLVMLRWGQRRPYKSREIATSTNTYVDLARTGIFS